MSSSVLVVDVERPAAGGRMVARHQGQVVLVLGAVPGERVRARVERVARGVVFAETVDVLAPSPDRRQADGDLRCGGMVLAHVRYCRQLTLKAEIVRDAFRRIARMELPSAVGVTGSPEAGYRSHARLHVREGRIGFVREGTHEVCDAGPTRQLASRTLEWLDSVRQAMVQRRLTGLSAIELAEDVAGDERACHVELRPGAVPADYRWLGEGLRGLSAACGDRPGVTLVAGRPAIDDHLRAGGGQVVQLTHDVRAFFQSNRFLLQPLVDHVRALVPPGPVLDLYAGVGLFGLTLAAAGPAPVTLVEGDPVSSRNLRRNAAPFASHVTVVPLSVEQALAEPRRLRVPADATVIVDPPRTGLSGAVRAGLLRLAPPRLVYVSCDVATLARDARALLDEGWQLASIAAMDMFPNTAHVECVALFTGATSAGGPRSPSGQGPAPAGLERTPPPPLASGERRRGPR